MMKHKNEIIRWANSSDGTKVWARGVGSDTSWKTVSCPGWFKSGIYIVDDEWAELRKAQADGKQLQHKAFDTGIFTNNYLCETTMETTYTEDWRIKPDEPIYEWQYIRYDEASDMFQFTVHKTEEEASIISDTIYKYEQSKRERK